MHTRGQARCSCAFQPPRRVASVRGCGGCAHGTQRALGGAGIGERLPCTGPPRSPAAREAACPGTPRPRVFPQRCGHPLGCVPLGGFPERSRRSYGSAWVRGGGGGLSVVSPQLLICRVWLLRRQALLTSRGTASSAADRRSPGVRRRRAAQRQRGGRAAAAGGARPCLAAPEEGAIQPPEQFPCFTPAEPSLFTILHVRSGPPLPPSSPCPFPPSPPGSVSSRRSRPAVSGGVSHGGSGKSCDSAPG